MRADRDRLLAPLLTEEARANVLLATFFAGLLARLWFLHVHPVGDFIASDMWVYDERAGHLFNRPPTPWDTFTPVGYPALLALVHRLFAKAYDAVGVLQAVLGGATAVLTHLIARRVSGSPAVALASGTIVALHPPLVLYSGFLLTETPSAFLLVLFVWLVLSAGDEATWARLAGAGVAFSLAVAVRPNFVLGLPAILWFAWARFGRERGPTFTFAARFCVAALPILLLVCLHNTRILGRPSGLATNGGLNFFLAHAQVSGAAYNERGFTHRIVPIPNALRYEARGAFVSPVPFYEEGFFYRRGFGEFAARPGELLASLDNVVEGVGLGRQGFWPGWKDHEAGLLWIARGFAVVAIVPAVAWGALLSWRRALSAAKNAGRALLFGLVLSVLLTLYVFLGDPRVRVPFDPLFVVLACDAWGEIVRRARR